MYLGLFRIHFQSRLQFDRTDVVPFMYPNVYVGWSKQQKEPSFREKNFFLRNEVFSTAKIVFVIFTTKMKIIYVFKLPFIIRKMDFIDEN